MFSKYFLSLISFNIEVLRIFEIDTIHCDYSGHWGSVGEQRNCVFDSWWKQWTGDWYDTWLHSVDHTKFELSSTVASFISLWIDVFSRIIIIDREWSLSFENHCESFVSECWDFSSKSCVGSSHSLHLSWVKSQQFYTLVSFSWNTENNHQNSNLISDCVWVNINKIFCFLGVRTWECSFLMLNTVLICWVFCIKLLILQTVPLSLHIIHFGICMFEFSSLSPFIHLSFDNFLFVSFLCSFNDL